MISLIATTLLPGVPLLLSEDGKQKGRKEWRKEAIRKEGRLAGTKVGGKQAS